VTPNEEFEVPAFLKTVIYPVTDLAQAKAVYAALLGAEPVVDETYYVQFNVQGNTGDQEVGLDPNGYSKGLTGPVGYWHVASIADALTALLKAGATEQQPITDFGGRQIATVADADGNVIGLLQTS
jgi:predicted enzyme related to lactoylglutathione lyase